MKGYFMDQLYIVTFISLKNTVEFDNVPHRDTVSIKQRIKNSESFIIEGDGLYLHYNGEGSVLITEK